MSTHSLPKSCATKPRPDFRKTSVLLASEGGAGRDQDPMVENILPPSCEKSLSSTWPGHLASPWPALCLFQMHPLSPPGTGLLSCL